MVQYKSIAVQDPNALADMGTHLHDALDPVYEQADVPYTFYTVHERGEVLGFVFGTNQRGKYSRIQVIAVTDAKAQLQQVHIQEIRNPAFAAFMNTTYGEQLASVALTDFSDLHDCWTGGTCSSPVMDPSHGKATDDHHAVLRALAKLDHLLRRVHLHLQADREITLEALAEHIGNHQMMELPRTIEATPEWSSVANTRLPEETPVLLWQADLRTKILPIPFMERTPHLRLTSSQIAWSGTSGTAYALPGAPNLVPTADVLLGERLLRSTDDGSTWLPSLGLALAGPSEGATLPSMGLPQVTWAEAREAHPKAKVLVGMPGANTPHHRVDMDRREALLAPFRAKPPISPESPSPH